MIPGRTHRSRVARALFWVVALCVAGPAAAHNDPCESERWAWYDCRPGICAPETQWTFLVELSGSPSELTILESVARTPDGDEAQALELLRSWALGESGWSEGWHLVTVDVSGQSLTGHWAASELGVQCGDTHVPLETAPLLASAAQSSDACDASFTEPLARCTESNRAPSTCETGTGSRGGRSVGLLVSLLGLLILQRLRGAEGRRSSAC